MVIALSIPNIRSTTVLDTQTPPPVGLNGGNGALVIGFELRDQRIRHMVHTLNLLIHRC